MLADQRIRDSAQRIAHSKERTKLLLERAEGLITNRLAFKSQSANSGVETDEQQQQRAFDLRAAIAVRETLKGELEQHRARRGRLTELHNELNVAEEEMCTVKLDINEHEMALQETHLKLADVENHLTVLISDLTALKDQLPKLYETEAYHRGQVEALGKELLAAKELVEKKRQLVIETEENLNYLMNVGMSSVMWSESEKQRLDNSTRPQRTVSKKWSTMGNLKGEDIIYDTDLTPRTAEWGKKQRESKNKYLWKVVYNAMKLGYLTNKIPFPPDAFLRMMNHIHGSNDAETIKDLQAQLSNSQRIVQDQTDAIKKLERVVNSKGDRHKEAELKYNAVQQKYEKLRVEVAALKRVISTMEDKSVTQLQKENELYEVERRNLYGKIYGRRAESSASLLARKASFSVENGGGLARSESIIVAVPDSEIPPITESKYLASSPVGGASSLTSESGLARQQSFVRTDSLVAQRSASSPTELRRVHTLTNAVMEAQTMVQERVQEFNGPSGTGFLQQQLDRYVVAQKQFDHKLNSVNHERFKILRKLELTEGLAMHAFDAFARGRQTVEEELETMMVESQKIQRLQLERYVAERKLLESRIAKLEQAQSVLERDYASSQSFVVSLEERCSQLIESKDALQEELQVTKEALEVASAECSAQDLSPLVAVMEKFGKVNCQDLVDYDTAIGRILPMKSQRAFSSIVSKLTLGVQQALLFIGTHLRRLFENSVRRTTASVLAAEAVGKKMQEHFESVLALSGSIGRTGLDAIESWDAFKREQHSDAATDVEGLPQPPPQYVEKVPEPVPSTSVETQTDESRASASKHNMSSQTAVVTVKTTGCETTIILGKGNGEGLGFVSADSLKRMEGLLKTKIREADDAQQRTEQLKKHASQKIDHFIRVEQCMHNHAMQMEDILADAAVRLSNDLVQSHQSVHFVDQSAQVSPQALGGLRAFQSQVWFPDSRPLLSSEAGVIDDVAPFHESDGSCGLSVVGRFPAPPRPCADTQTNVVLQDAGMCTDWNASVFTSSNGDDDGGVGRDASALPTFNMARLIMPPTPTATASPVSPHTSHQTSPASSPHRAGSLRGALAMLHHPPALLPLSFHSSETQTELTLPANNSVVDLATFEAFCGSVRSPTPPTVHVPVVDEELTAKAIAELEKSLESRLLDEFNQHKQLLEDQLDAKARDYDRQHEQVDRDALKLRVRVSDIQQNYEAIAASVTKFKYAAKQLEATRKELQQERALRQECESKLLQVPITVARSKQRSLAQSSGPASSQISSDAATPLRGGVTGRNPSNAQGGLGPSVAVAAARRGSARACSNSAVQHDPVAAELEIRTLRREKEQLTIQSESLKAQIVQLQETVELQHNHADGTMSKFLQQSGSVASGARRDSAVRAKFQLRAAQRFSLSSSALVPGEPISVPRELTGNTDDEGPDSVSQQLQNRVNELQLQLLGAHKDIMEVRAGADSQLHALREQLEHVQVALSQSEALAKKLQAEEARAKNDLQKERVSHNDAIALLEHKIDEQTKKAIRAKSDWEKKYDSLLKQNESTEKLSLSFKKQLQAAREALEELQSDTAMAVSQHAAKARAAANLVSQLHCALVEAAVAVKSALVLDSFQLADPMMGETAVNLMRLLVGTGGTEHESDRGERCRSDQMLDLSKYLGDRDVELLRRMTLAVKYYAGVATTSAESSRPTTREAAGARTELSTPHTFGMGGGLGFMEELTVDAAPLPMTPHRHPPTSTLLIAQPDVSIIRAQEPHGDNSNLTKLPQIQLQARSPSRRPVFDVKLSEKEHTFSLFSTSSAINAGAHLHESKRGARSGEHARPFVEAMNHPLTRTATPLLPPRSASTPPDLSVINGHTTGGDTSDGDRSMAEQGRVVRGILPSRTSLGSRKTKRRIVLKQ